MKYKIPVKRVVASILAVLLIFQIVYQEKGMFAKAETGQEEETELSVEETGPTEEVNSVEETGLAEEVELVEETELLIEEIGPTEETGATEETEPVEEIEKKNILVCVTTNKEETGVEKIENAQVTLQGDNMESEQVQTTNAEGQCTFSDIEVKGNYSVTIKKEGYVTVARTVTEQEMSETEGESIEIPVEIAAFSFQKTGESVAWNTKTYENAVVSTDGEVAAQYAISACRDGEGNEVDASKYVAVDKDTGVVTLQDLSEEEDVVLPVTLTIEASGREGEEAFEGTASYTLTITKAQQTLEWDSNIPEHVLYYGMEGISIIAKGDGTEAVTYEKTAGGDYFEIGTDGMFSWSKVVGETEEINAVVTAAKAADTLYEEVSSTYDFVLKRKQVANDVTINGFKYKDGSLQQISEVYQEGGQNGWFSGDSLTISKSGAVLGESESIEEEAWNEVMALTKEDCQQKEFYVREADGSISAKLSVSGILWDNVAPLDLTISYAAPEWSQVLEKITFGYYKAPIEVTVTAKDHGSGIDYLEWGYVSVTDKKAGIYKKIEGDYLGKGEDAVTLTFLVEEEEDMQIDFTAYDRAGNYTNYQDLQNAIVLDKKAPEISVDYDNNASMNGNYYRKKRNATITVKETHFDAKRVFITVDASDSAGNACRDLNVFLGKDKKAVTVSELSEEVKKEEYWTDDHKLILTYEENAHYHISIQAEDMSGNLSAIHEEDFWIDTEQPNGLEVRYNVPVASKQKGEIVKNYYSDKIEITISAKDDESEIDYLEWRYTSTESGESSNYIKVIPEKIEKSGKVEASVTLEQEDSVQIDFTAYDKAGNAINYKDAQNVLILDKKNPDLKVSYDNNEVVNSNYYAKKRTMSIQVTEKNFDPENMNLSFTAETIARESIPNCKALLGKKEVKVSELSEEMKKAQYWKTDGDVHTASITWQEDAHYRIQIQAIDLSQRSSKGISHDFWIDTKKPNGLEIKYSTPLLEKVLEKITFGYYKSSVNVTFIAKDVTAGVQTLDWKYTKEKSSSARNLGEQEGTIPSSKIVYSDYGRTATAKVRLTGKEAKQYRGNISFSVTDKAGNSRTFQDKENRIVVDTISPTMKVDYTPINQSGKKAYFNGKALLNFHIEEANFYPQDVVIKVNGEVKSCKNWTQEEGTDNWNGAVSLKKDGDYKVTVEYQDRSTNQMVSYESPILVVDTVKPTIQVSYDDNRPVYSEDGIGFYEKQRTATIQIKDKNFRAKDVEVVIGANKADGTVVECKDYAGYLKQSVNWKKNGDVNIATITYDMDADYTFDISYIDMAKNKADAYAKERFIVDTTPPVNLQVRYSESVLETILENLSFGFYDARMTVTVTAEDDVAGVHHFVYDYLNGENVSNINEQMSGQRIEKEQISYSNGRKTATAQFTIPKSELGENGQFNGTIGFDVVDNSNNQEHMGDDKRIVVDSITPTAEVTYNAPITSVNGIGYYAETVSGQIRIAEANFQAEDVVVSATKDGLPYGLSVSWSDENVDSHNGSFQLSEDGDYQITINYTDKSGNIMGEYQSGQLTVDATAPVITVEEVANGSAYNKEMIGLRILAEDNNFDVSSFEPLLTAVVREENGSFVTKDYSELGTVSTVAEGKSYVYEIDNIPEDAIYSLSCTVKDFSLNEASNLMTADPGNDAMDNIMFSVNRNGSTFMLDTVTKDLVESYYVPEVEKDVVLKEINCDPVKQHEVTVNGESLKEGVQYKVEDSRGDNTWYQYDYILDKDNFEEERDYTVVVSTTDKAENVAYSDMKNIETSFVVDRTEPVVVVSGLSDNGRYQVASQTVNVIPTDDGGMLEHLQISIYDNDNQLIEKAVSARGTELLESIEQNEGKVVFEVPQGINQKISVLCADAAGNIYEKSYQNVTVSTEWYIMMFANKPLFYGSLAGLVAVLFIGGFGIRTIRRKKKK